jgi:ribonucrease Y
VVGDVALPWTECLAGEEATMDGVLYAAVGVVFVLGLLFVGAYHRRGLTSTPNRATDPSPERPAREVDAETAAAREAASAELAARRRAAEAEAEAIRRAAAAEAAAAQAESDVLVSRASNQATDILADARRRAEVDADRLTAELRVAERELAARDTRLVEAEDGLTARESLLAAQSADLQAEVNLLHARQRDLDATAADLDRRAADVQAGALELEQRQSQHLEELERVAGLTVEQARAELLTVVEAGARRDAAVLVRTIENEARSEGSQRARSIVAEAVQRVASAQTTETVVSVMHLPAEEMKGRIIGREGRNIRAFEAVTGVNVIIDDTPEAVLLSCFDPVRREIGRLTLDKLVVDGRIHPHRIEEAYEQSKTEVDELCLRAARDALADVGIGQLDERLLPTLGRLKYRASYGQNVLGHLIETAHIAGVMAAELGIEPTLVKRCAFLHDIGKALTHEVEGSHAIIGAELLRRYGEDEAVAHAVEAHHNEVTPRTIEAVLTQASDTCSAARPGARRESLESYVKRLARIEEIASAKPGVEKVFAMQAGREVRVMVQPSEVDDLAAGVIAREIAKQIEDELTYPGQIRVTVVRESRATEVAH